MPLYGSVTLPARRCRRRRSAWCWCCAPVVSPIRNGAAAVGAVVQVDRVQPLDVVGGAADRLLGLGDDVEGAGGGSMTGVPVMPTSTVMSPVLTSACGTVVRAVAPGRWLLALVEVEEVALPEDGAAVRRRRWRRAVVLGGDEDDVVGAGSAPAVMFDVLHRRAAGRRPGRRDLGLHSLAELVDFDVGRVAVVSVMIDAGAGEVVVVGEDVGRHGAGFERFAPPDEFARSHAVVEHWAWRRFTISDKWDRFAARRDSGGLQY